MQETINTCYILTMGSIRTIAYYSHLIPVFFALLLSFLVLFKAKKSILSKIFFAFSLSFSLWLVGDLITWTSNNYFLIYATWSLLVYIEILFFALGLYFVVVFVRKSDVGILPKLLLFSTTLLPLIITIFQKSVTGFNYPVCEAFNNTFLDQYKLYLEILVLIGILFYLVFPFFKKNQILDKKSHIIVLGSIFLFLSVFGITEYLASVTAYYEIHLYALFIIPVFLIAITYSIFRLDIFNLKIISTYFLVFGFLILSASQLLFINSTTDRLLSIITLILSISIAILLFRNLRRESDQRIQIEKLNINLQNLIKQRESLEHLITHKVKGSFTHSKYIFSGMLDGMFGEINPEVKKMAEMGLDSDNVGIRTVDLILNASNLQKGLVKYEMKPINLKDVVTNIAQAKKELMGKKDVTLKIDIKDEIYNIKGDIFWIKEVFGNLIDNAINYTPSGDVVVSLEKKEKKIVFCVKDTGVGITDVDKRYLFTEGGRGKNSVKVNVNSTGYGLYSAKLIVEAHKGKIWAESEGEGKGSSFFVEFDEI